MRGLTVLLLSSFSLVVVGLGQPLKADTSPVCWWKFDGDANDSSIYGRHGTAHGGPGYAAGIHGQAISLDGIDDWVEYDLPDQAWAAFTVAVWVKTDALAQDQYSAVFNNNSDGSDFQFDVDGASPGTYRYRGTANAELGPVAADWVHLAAACDGTDTSLYYNGEHVTTIAAADLDFGRFAVGVNRNTTNWFAGTVDELRIYDRQLSATEIAQLQLSPLAVLQSPEDAAILDDTQATLTWAAGLYAADSDGHEVFLSPSFDEVNACAVSSSLGTTSNEFYHVSDLEPGTLYYWRINEVNDSHPESPWKGEIRSFRVRPATAWDPYPAHLARSVATDVTLAWEKGLGAVLQAVYFGRSFAEVDAGTGDTFKGQQSWTTYAPQNLERDTVYYWRIDTLKSDMIPVKGPVWSFRTRAITPIVEPNLVAWWTLDDQGLGSVVPDSSGYDHYGTLFGGRYVPGFWGGAVEFDGIDDYINIDGYKGVLGTGPFSISAWIKARGNGEIVGWGKATGRQRVEFRVNSNRLRCEHGSGNVQGDTNVTDDEWHHVALTVIEGAEISHQAPDFLDVNIYLDGIDDTRSSKDTEGDRFDIQADHDLKIGRRYNGADERWFTGIIDDVRIYDRLLSDAEIQVLAMRPTATAPSPADGAVLEQTTVQLGWKPGRFAASHELYFGTDPAELPLVAGELPLGAETFGPVEVELGKTYYWSVTEVNAPARWAGPTWTFDVADYLVVDDFDSYASVSGPNEPTLLGTWTDGSTNATGSTISLEPEFAGNSMKLAYDNTASPFISQAGLEYSTPRDWTAGGIKALALQFRGDANNLGGQLFLAVDDADANGAALTYDEPNALAEDTSRTWNIALSRFAEAGVDLSRIKKLLVGVSDGQAGAVYIDEIRLYPPRCVREYAPNSLNDDCITDYDDLDLLLRHWLAGGYSVSASPPDDARLQAHYKFDETSGTVAADSSGKGRDAVVEPNGADAWDPGGRDGYCLDFDGTFAVSVPNDVFAGVSEQVTICVWAYLDANVPPYSVGRAEFAAGPVDPNQAWDRVTWIQDRPADGLGRWNHYAFVKDARLGLMRIYHNGLLVAQQLEAFKSVDGAAAGESRIGSDIDGSGGYLEAKLDDLRIYDYALPHAEVLYLAGGSSLDQPLVPVLAPADPYEDGMVDLADFAVLGRMWLREALWP